MSVWKNCAPVPMAPVLLELIVLLKVLTSACHATLATPEQCRMDSPLRPRVRRIGACAVMAQQRPGQIAQQMAMTNALHAAVASRLTATSAQRATGTLAEHAAGWLAMVGVQAPLATLTPTDVCVLLALAISKGNAERLMTATRSRISLAVITPVFLEHAKEHTIGRAGARAAWTSVPLWVILVRPASVTPSRLLQTSPQQNGCRARIRSPITSLVPACSSQVSAQWRLQPGSSIVVVMIASP